MHYISLIILSIILSPFLARRIKPKFCVDCKHFTKNSFITNKYGQCTLFEIEEDNDYFLVDGNVNNDKIKYYYCNTARKFNDLCGEEGKFFEKKTTHSNKKSCK
jgi:hypothetical protein